MAPELDDGELGNVRRQLVAPRIPGQLDLSAGLVEQLFLDTGADWDRRAHRMGVLAQVAPYSLVHGWRRQRPGNPDAVLFHAWVDLAHAQREGALENPGSTVDRCYRAADLCPEDPTPWLVLLSVLRLLGRPQGEVFAIAKEVWARDVWHRDAHLQMLGYLSPDEYGSHAQVLDFVDHLRLSAPPNSPVAALELTMMVNRYRARVSAGGVGALGAWQLLTRPDAETAMERALAHWPRPGFLRHAAAVADLNVLAYALVHANRTARAGPVFLAIDQAVTVWPWSLDGDPVKQFSYRQAQARR